LELFSETWPSSGMTRGGQAYELPTPVHLTIDLGSSSSPSLPTPVVNDMGAGKTPEAWDEWTAKTKEKHQNGNGHGPSLNIEMLRLKELSWGKFEPVICRWEQVVGRPAPEPTKPDGTDGAHRLSSSFTEWMMGLPDGWITDVGLTRQQELKACGNGVVPQQAALALKILLDGINLN